MPHGQLDSVLHYLRHSTGDATARELTDAQLLGRYLACRDQDAFATLVRRYGRLVRSVCRHVLHHDQDVEDAFQVTFLVFASKAASIRKTTAVASFLHGVAYRTALNIRRARARSRPREPSGAVRAVEQPVTEAALREIQAILDEEVNRLPDKYRAPFVLCCLEGKSRTEAAADLGCKEGTVFSRLARARKELQRRLARRGVALTAALCAVELSREAAPAALVHGTIRAALSFAAGRTIAEDLMSAEVANLAKGVLQTMRIPKLKIATAVLLAVGFLTGAGAAVHHALAAKPAEARRDEKPQPPDKPKNPGADTPRSPAAEQAHPDPLPPEALTRLGTSRLRGHRCRFLPDGWRLVRERADGGLQIFEVPSGKPLARIRGTDVPGRKEIVGSTIAFTRDSKYLAAVCWEGRSGIWETATGRLVRWLDSGKFYSIVRCDFSPDGKLLAVGASVKDTSFEDITVGVYEVETGRRLFTTLGTNSVFAPDGKSLVSWQGYNTPRSTALRVAVPTGKRLSALAHSGERYSSFDRRSDGVYFFEVLADSTVRVREVASGEVKHTFRGAGHGDNDVISVRHAPGRRELIAVGSRPPGVWCWDLDTGKELWQVRLAAPAYFPQLSADGKTLVTADRRGTVQVWDVATGKERTSFRPATIGHGVGGRGMEMEITVSPDGKTVASTSGGIFCTAVALWDAATGKLLSDLPGHPSAITATAFAPDGSKVYTIGKDRTQRTWDAASGRELSRCTAEPSTNLAVSPDGKTLFAGGTEDGSVRVLDALTGRVERRLGVFKRTLIGLALTADGKRLIVAGRDENNDAAYRVRICDAGTGAKLREFDGPNNQIEQMAVRPDGGAVATSHVGRRVRLWDGAGNKVSEHVGRGERISAWAKGETPYRIGSLALSADGRWLAYSDQEQGVAIVDARGGREVGRAKPAGVYYQNGAARYELRDVLAFSPDGKTVAWSGVESTAEIFLIEVRSHQVRRRLSGDSYPVQHLAFSPDGSRLLSSGPDGSALIWDVLGRSTIKPAAAPPPADQVAAWWDALADTSAEKAYRTMREMAAHPSAAVTLLRAKVKPIQAVEAAKLDALLAGLDADDFKDRERASEQLVALADAAEPRLRAALRQSPSLEVKRRAEDVLNRIEKADRLRSERSVEVLEMIGDAAAVKLLRELAGGLPGASRTTDAAAAIGRSRP